FQLLSLAEQNAAMRQRRQSEVSRGYDQLRGTFAQVISAAARGGVAADEMRAVVANLRVRPVITAHPTEAKRVTVLEKHRRIYRRLVDLEAPRWTPRERGALVENLRTEIELLWLTGELRLALSVTERAAPIAPEFRQALARELAASGDAERIQQRNRGEVYRQFVTCMLRKLDATLTSAERRETAPETAAYRTADELIADLRTLEDGLVAARGERAADLLVRPVRREVEAFRFSTFRLDVR